MVYQDQTLAMGGRCDGRTGAPYTGSVRVTIDSDQSNEMGAGQDLVGTTCFRADVPEQEDDTCLLADVSAQEDDTCLLADVSAQELEDDTCLLADVSAQEDDTCLLADVSAQKDDTCLLADVSAQAKTLYEWHCALQVGLPRSNSCDGFIHPAAMTAIMVTHTLG
jgi:hypothetical protein